MTKITPLDYPNKTLKILIDGEEDISQNHENCEIYKASEIEELKKDIDSEFWILLDGEISPDFIRKAILHYQYI